METYFILIKLIFYSYLAFYIYKNIFLEYSKSVDPVAFLKIIGFKLLIPIIIMVVINSILKFSFEIYDTSNFYSLDARGIMVFSISLIIFSTWDWVFSYKN